jgi:flagellar hook assembly protein FlgD
MDKDGKERKKLYSGNLNQGNQSIQWDGTDEAGKEVSSGIYKIVINTGYWSGSKNVLKMD